MRRPKKRTVLMLAALPLLAGITAVVWKLNDWPPPRLILKYGFPPSGGPTGRIKVIEEIEFVELKPGYFRMGSPYGFGYREGDFIGKICRPFGLSFGEEFDPGDEGPMVWVEVPQPLWVARTEVTNTQYERFCADRTRPRHSANDSDPVTDVSWDEATAFCEWLTQKHAGEFRLPSEAAWEFACRAGSSTKYSFGDDDADLGRHAWFRDNSGGRTHPVAEKAPNRWGLHDLHGNVWEWCEDIWHENHSDLPPADAQTLDGTTRRRVLRGGGWFGPVSDSRSAIRDYALPTFTNSIYGFRPVFTLPEKE